MPSKFLANFQGREQEMRHFIIVHEEHVVNRSPEFDKQQCKSWKGIECDFRERCPRNTVTRTTTRMVNDASKFAPKKDHVKRPNASNSLLTQESKAGRRNAHCILKPLLHIRKYIRLVLGEREIVIFSLTKR